LEYAAKVENSGKDLGLHNKLYASDTDEENATQHCHVHGQGIDCCFISHVLRQPLLWHKNYLSKHATIRQAT